MSNNIAKDIENLRVLSIFHYVVGGLGCLMSCIPLIHMIVGLVFILSPEILESNGGDSLPAFIGWMFFAMGLLFFLVCQGVSICIIISGRFIAKQKKYLFSFISGCIECAFFPFGTVLGVFTIVILSRDSVKKLYGRE